MAHLAASSPDDLSRVAHTHGAHRFVMLESTLCVNTTHLLYVNFSNAFDFATLSFDRASPLRLKLSGTPEQSILSTNTVLRTLYLPCPYPARCAESPFVQIGSFFAQTGAIVYVRILQGDNLEICVLDKGPIHIAKPPNFSVQRLIIVLNKLTDVAICPRAPQNLQNYLAYLGLSQPPQAPLPEDAVRREEAPIKQERKAESQSAGASSASTASVGGGTDSRGSEPSSGGTTRVGSAAAGNSHSSFTIGDRSPTFGRASTLAARRRERRRERKEA